MTCFMLFDELERDFELLEQDPARHAAAVAAYALLGQAVAQRMLDGALPQWLISKKLMAWPREMVSIALADLLAIAILEQDQLGELRFKDWDIRQFTREQENARREKHAKRQREYRKRKLERRIPDHSDASRAPSRDASRDGPLDLTSKNRDLYVGESGTCQGSNTRAGGRVGARGADLRSLGLGADDAAEADAIRDEASGTWSRP